MNTKNKSFKDILVMSLGLLKKHFIFFFLVSITFLAVLFLLDLEAKVLTEPFYREYSGSGFIVDRVIYLLNAFFALVVFLFYLCFLLKSIKEMQSGKSLNISSLLALAVKRFPAFLIVNILFFIRIFVGLILLVFPGLFQAFNYSFAGIFIIEEGHKVKDAFKNSKRIATNSAMQYIDYSLIVPAVFILTMCIYIVMEMLIGILVQSNLDFIAQILDFIEIFIFVTVWNFTLVYFVYMYNELRERLEKGEQNNV